MGNIFSSPTFDNFGYYGVYGINTSAVTVALFYTIFMVRNYPPGYESPEKTDPEEKSEDVEMSWFRSKVVHPLKDLFHTLLRKRPHNLRTLLLVNFFAMTMYYATAEVMKVQGISMRPFPGYENAAGKLRQKRLATAGTKFPKPGNGLIQIPCINHKVTRIYQMIKLSLLRT